MPDQSRWCHAVWAGESDVVSFEELKQLVWPHGREVTDRKLRDVMHVHAAMRHGLDAFVTRDGTSRQRRGLLNAAADVEQRVGFKILTPEEALTLASVR